MLLGRIAEKDESGEHASLDGVDYLGLTVDVLQHAVRQRKGPLALVGGNDGLRLTRAAFAVIVKFSEQVPLF